MLQCVPINGARADSRLTRFQMCCAFSSGRAVRTGALSHPVSRSDQPRLRVAAFGVYASPPCSPGTGESKA